MHAIVRSARQVCREVCKAEKTRLHWARLYDTVGITFEVRRQGCEVRPFDTV